MEIGTSPNAYISQQEVSPCLTAIIQKALQEFLSRRGFALSARKLHITPAIRGSTTRTVSVDHDHYLTCTSKPRMSRIFVPLVLIFLNMVTSVHAWQRINLGRLEIKLTPVASEYCHVIRFPKGWSVPRQDKNGQPLLFDYASEYEFRVEGVLSTRFLVGGYTRLGQRYYTFERYKVDLSDRSAPIVAASPAAWNAAAVIPLIEKSIFPPVGTATGEAIDFHGFRFAKSGEFWVQPASDASRLSPHQTWAWCLAQNVSAREGRLKYSSMCSAPRREKRCLH